MSPPDDDISNVPEELDLYCTCAGPGHYHASWSGRLASGDRVAALGCGRSRPEAIATASRNLEQLLANLPPVARGYRGQLGFRLPGGIA